GADRGDGGPAAREPRAERQRDPRSARGEHLPLHGLRTDPRGGAHRGAGAIPMTIAPPRPATRTRIRRGLVGESRPRADAVHKVKGAFEYASDLQLPGMLVGHTLRSPHPHARIRSIDVSKAKAMPGVRAVLTSRDLPTRALIGLMKRDQPVLADGVVRY